jgi:hypothetical protein
MGLCGVGLLTWFLYFVSSLGYFMADGLSASFTDITPFWWNVIYTSLAVLTVVDALFYMADWLSYATVMRYLLSSQIMREPIHSGYRTN